MTILEAREQIIKNLDIIFNNRKSVRKMKEKQFGDLVKKQINILNFIEDQLKIASNERKADFFVNQYKEKTEDFFIINKELTYKTPDEMYDDINYLPIFIRNIFNSEITELANDYKEVVKFNNKENFDEETSDKIAKINFSNKNNKQKNVEFISSLLNQDPKKISVVLKFNEDIRNGKIFPYTHKSKQIKIIKITSFIILALLAIHLFVWSGFVFACNPVFLSQKSKDNNDGTKTFISAIFLLIFAISITFTLKKFVTNYMKNINNEKYYYNVSFSYLYIFFLFLNIITYNAIYGWDGQWLMASIDTLVQQNPNINIALWGWYYSLIISIILTVCFIVTIFLAKIYNPEIDKEYLKSVLEKRMNEADEGSSIIND